MLTFGTALKKACDHESNHDAMHLPCEAKVVHREMFVQNLTFNGSFSEHDVVPQSLLVVVNMTLEGPNIKHHITTQPTQRQLSLHARRRSRGAEPPQFQLSSWAWFSAGLWIGKQDEVEAADYATGMGIEKAEGHF